MPAIVTVTLNPAIDVSTSVARVAPVRKLRCGPARRDPGGGGINVARVARRLGGDVLAVYPAGGDTGRRLSRGLEAEGLPSACVAIAGETREDFTVAETDSGREFRFVLPGPALAEVEWRACLQAAAAPAAPFLVASGNLPPGVPEDLHARLARAAPTSRLVVDSSGAPLKAALAAGVWLVKPNLRELQEASGRELADDGARLAAARAVVAAGAAQWVALTLGAEGAMLVGAGGAWRAGGLALTPVSTVGAGDSFLGGLVQALAAGQPPEAALRQGVAAGSAALLVPGTGLCDAAEVRRLLPRVEVTVL